MSALADYRMLWGAAVNQRQPKAVALARRAVPPVTLLVAGATLYFTQSWTLALAHGLWVPITVLVLMWTYVFVPAAMLLNTPVNARLVPRMRSRLKQMTGLAWFLSASVPALALAGVTLEALGLFLLLGLWIVIFGLVRAGHRSGMWLYLGAIFVLLAKNRLPAALLALPADPVAMTLLSLLGLAGAAWALGAVFPRSAEQHWRAQDKLNRVNEKATAKGQFRSDVARGLRAAIYLAVFRRDCAWRSGALLLHVLGPSAHWSQSSLSMAGLLLAGVLGKLYLYYYASAEQVDMAAGIGWLFLTPLMLLQLFDLERRAALMDRTRGEQALLRMAPLAAPAVGFNRQLGRALLGESIRTWSMLVVTVLVLTALTGASGAELTMQASLCCLVLPPIAAPLRDHARHAGMAGWMLVLGLAVSIAVSVVTALYASRMLGVPAMPILALASMAIAAGTVAWRWRTMLASPAAFPVGRMA